MLLVSVKEDAQLDGQELYVRQSVMTGPMVIIVSTAVVVIV